MSLYSLNRQVYTILILFFCTLFTKVYADQEELHEARLAVDTLFFSDKPRALEISELFLTKSLAANDTFHITYFLDQAGELNRYLGNFKRAEEQLKKCLSYKVNWEDLKDLSITYNNLGKVYKQTGQFELAFSSFNSAYELMEKIDNPFGKGYYLNNIGTVFDDQHNYEKAIEYYDRSFEMKKITKDSNGMAVTSFNIGILYYNLEKYQEALNYFNRSYQSVSYQKSSRRKLKALTNIAQIKMELGEVDECEVLLEEASQYLAQVKNPTVSLDYVSVKSRMHLAQGAYDSAAYYNQLAFAQASSLGLPIKMQRALSVRSDIFKEKGNIDSAYHYLKTVHMYYDTIVTEANIKSIADLEGKYQFERKNREIKETQLAVALANETLKGKRLQLAYLILALFVTASIAMLAIFRSRANKRNADLVKGQNALIAQQNHTLKEINHKLESELNHLQVSVSEKEEILDKVFSKGNEEKLSPELISLSKREREVLANLALGLSDAQLAEKLFLSKTTVKTHLRRIYSKLLVKNRLEAVAIAHRYEIIGTLAEN